LTRHVTAEYADVIEMHLEQHFYYLVHRESVQTWTRDTP